MDSTPLHQEYVDKLTADGHAFWYSRRAALLSIVFFILVVQSISPVIPPFQSPDEDAHLKRAYLLAKGEIFYPLAMAAQERN